jgi:hypothetical protein
MGKLIGLIFFAIFVSMVIAGLLPDPPPAIKDVCDDHDSVGWSRESCERWVGNGISMHHTREAMFEMLRHFKEATTERPWTRARCEESNAHAAEFNAKLMQVRKAGSPDKSHPLPFEKCAGLPK